jgi:predicted amidophosphoribosyltransferase
MAAERCPVCCHPESVAGDPCSNPLCSGYADERRFGRALAATTLSGDIGMMVHLLKPRDPDKAPKRHYASVLGGFLAGWAMTHPDDLAGYDLVMPMPAHPDRVTEIGVDIPAVLVRCLQRTLGQMEYVLKADEIATKSHRVEARSHGNSWQERREAVKDAYQVSPGSEARLAGASVLVVDDVFTTGLNLDALAGELLAAGASDVDGLVVARAIHDGGAREGGVG